MSEQKQKMADAAEMLWVVLANVSGGDWTKQSTEWQEAAARWRDNYFAAVLDTPTSLESAPRAQEARSVQCGWDYAGLYQRYQNVLEKSTQLEAELQRLSLTCAQLREENNYYRGVIQDAREEVLAVAWGETQDDPNQPTDLVVEHGLAHLLARAEAAEARARELQAEHQCCLDGDEGWAEKFKRQNERLIAERDTLRAALETLEAEWQRQVEVERAAVIENEGQREKDLLEHSADTFEICADQIRALLTPDPAKEPSAEQADE